jgi:adenylosuccinate synthase
VETKQIPFQMTRVNIEPVMTSFPGWATPTSECKTAEDLPETVRNYIAFINEQIGVPVKWVSNGPGRDQIITL